MVNIEFTAVPANDLYPIDIMETLRMNDYTHVSVTSFEGRSSSKDMLQNLGDQIPWKKFRPVVHHVVGEHFPDIDCDVLVLRGDNATDEQIVDEIRKSVSLGFTTYASCSPNDTKFSVKQIEDRLAAGASKIFTQPLMEMSTAQETLLPYKDKVVIGLLTSISRKKFTICFPRPTYQIKEFEVERFLDKDYWRHYMKAVVHDLKDLGFEHFNVFTFNKYINLKELGL